MRTTSVTLMLVGLILTVVSLAAPHARLVTGVSPVAATGEVGVDVVVLPPPGQTPSATSAPPTATSPPSQTPAPTAAAPTTASPSGGPIATAPSPPPAGAAGGLPTTGWPLLGGTLLLGLAALIVGALLRLASRRSPT